MTCINIQKKYHAQSRSPTPTPHTLQHGRRNKRKEAIITRKKCAYRSYITTSTVPLQETTTVKHFTSFSTQIFYSIPTPTKMPRCRDAYTTWGMRPGNSTSLGMEPQFFSVSFPCSAMYLTVTPSFWIQPSLRPRA